MGQTDVNVEGHNRGPFHAHAGGSFLDKPAIGFRFHHGQLQIDTWMPDLNPNRRHILLGVCITNGPDEVFLADLPNARMSIHIDAIKELLVLFWGALWQSLETALGPDQTRRAVMGIARIMLQTNR